jgi:hypothetical protein
MSRQFSVVNAAADTFAVWINRTNSLVNLTNTDVVTTIANTSGDTTTGNGFVIGIFGGTTLVANTMRGGNVSTNTALTIVSNTIFTGSQVNSLANVYLNSANIYSNTTSFSIVGNTYIITTGTTSNTLSYTTNGSFSTFDITSDNTSVNSSITFIKDANFNNVASFNSNTFLNANTYANIVNVANTLTVAGNTTFNSYTIHNSINYRNTGTYSFSGTSQVAIDTVAMATYRSAEYTIQFTDSSTTSYHITKVIVYHDGTTAYSVEYAQMFNNVNLASITADINSGNLRLLVTPATSTVTAKFTRSLLTV